MVLSKQMIVATDTLNSASTKLPNWKCVGFLFNAWAKYVISHILTKEAKQNIINRIYNETQDVQFMEGFFDRRRIRNRLTLEEVRSLFLNELVHKTKTPYIRLVTYVQSHMWHDVPKNLPLRLFNGEKVPTTKCQMVRQFCVTALREAWGYSNEAIPCFNMQSPELTGLMNGNEDGTIDLGVIADCAEDLGYNYNPVLEHLRVRRVSQIDEPCWALFALKNEHPRNVAC